MIKTIVADPAWNERGGGKIKRGADRHYRLLSTEGNIALMKDWLNEYESYLNHDLHFYLWVTNNFLRDGFKVLDALGFRYITNIVWVKPSIGLGQYFRGQHELCLFCTRNRGFGVKTEDKTISSVMKADKRKHSQKPECFYELVEQRSEGKYLYLYSRSVERKGWIMRGDEVGKLEPFKGGANE